MKNENLQTNRLSRYGIVVVILFVGALLWFAIDRDEPNIPVDDGQKHDIAVSTTTLALIKTNKQTLAALAQNSPFENSIANWQTYVDEESGFTIKYPADLVKLTMETSGDLRGGIFLQRSILFETYDACDLRGAGEGGGKILTEIPDFELGIRVAPRPFKEIVGEEADYTGDKLDALVTRIMYPEGMDGGTDIGPFKGFSWFTSSEGCGEDRFYVPLDVNITLIVWMPIPLDSLSPMGANREGQEKFAKIQSQYPPIDREYLSNQILSTFRLLDK